MSELLGRLTARQDVSNLSDTRRGEELKVAAYLRSATSPGAVEQQRAKIRAWANSQDVHLVEEFEDVCAGMSIDRPGFRDLARAIDQGKVDRVVVYGFDRLTRDLRLRQPLIDAFVARGIGIHDLLTGLTIEGNPDPILWELGDALPCDRRGSREGARR